MLHSHIAIKTIHNTKKRELYSLIKEAFQINLGLVSEPSKTHSVLFIDLIRIIGVINSLLTLIKLLIYKIMHGHKKI